MMFFSHDLPPNLPHLQYIQHAIDWILRAPFPNNIAYRIAPKEKDELQKQV